MREEILYGRRSSERQRLPSTGGFIRQYGIWRLVGRRAVVRADGRHKDKTAKTILILMYSNCFRH